MAKVTDGTGPVAKPPEPTPADDAPIDPQAVRIDVEATMGVHAAPWTIGPDGVPGIDVHWLDGERAVAFDRRDVDNPRRDPVILGASEPPSRTGVQRQEVVVGGWRILLAVEPERTARLRERARRGREDAAHTGPLEVRAIIPGRVVAVSVAEGDTVDAGQQLLVVEAMKMQNELRSPRAGTVERIAVGVGQTVDLAALLLVLR